MAPEKKDDEDDETPKRVFLDVLQMETPTGFDY